MNKGIIIGIIIAVAIAIGFGALMSSDNSIQPPDNSIQPPETDEIAETEVTTPDSYSVTLEESVSTADGP